MEQTIENCKHRENCNKENCKFAHPYQCRNGTLCYDQKECKFIHTKVKYLCNHKNKCSKDDCQFRHPYLCLNWRDCPYTNCKFRHVPHLEQCIYGLNCKDLKHGCMDQHKPQIIKPEIIYVKKELYLKKGQKDKNGDAYPYDIYLYPKIKPTPNNLVSSKIVIVVGQSGSGKSLLLDSMINYLQGVKFSTNFRYKLVDESKQKKNCAYSQTSKINLYFIDKRNILGQDLVLIDTPGFLDTEGMERDKKIQKNLSELLSNTLTQIHLICFVCKSSENRLTPEQQYVFQNVFSLFAKDVSPNIAALLPFCDSENPQVLEAFQEAQLRFISEKNYFKFNNSALYTEIDDKQIDQEYKVENFSKFEPLWNINSESLANFFQKLMIVKPQSLRLTKEMLIIKIKLESHIESLQGRINKALEHLCKATDAKNEINLKAKQIDQLSLEQKIVQKKFRWIKKPNNPQVTNTTCANCLNICHQNCAYTDDKDKHLCCAMDSDGYCNNCPIKQKCKWQDHNNLPYEYVQEEYQEEITISQLKQKFQQSNDKMKNSQNLLLEAIGEQIKIVFQLQHDFDVIKESIESMYKICLCEQIHTQTDTLKDLIAKEEKKINGDSKKLIYFKLAFEQSEIIEKAIFQLKEKKNQQQIQQKQNESNDQGNEYQDSNNIDVLNVFKIQLIEEQKSIEQGTFEYEQQNRTDNTTNCNIF